MTKKDYAKLAKMLSVTRPTHPSSWGIKGGESEQQFKYRCEQHALVINSLMSVLKYDNPNFDREKFKAACLK